MWKTWNSVTIREQNISVVNIGGLTGKTQRWGWGWMGERCLRMERVGNTKVL